MSVRDRRLQSDYISMRDTFPEGGKIKIVATFGNPVDKYNLEFNIQSLALNQKGQPVFKNKHLVEIYLPVNYPRQAPQCRMVTPVFHPNIAPHAICIGDHWAIGESLPHLVVRIGEMLAYQSYNLKSPLNGEAAQWTDLNKIKLPTDKTDFSSFYETTNKSISDKELKELNNLSIVKCVNCGDSVHGHDLIICSSNHPVCRNCAFSCVSCGKTICLKCVTSKCSICNSIVCAHCHTICSLCGNNICAQHTKVCSVCGKKVCDDCSVICSKCGKYVCIDHLHKLSSNEYCCHNCFNNSSI